MPSSTYGDRQILVVPFYLNRPPYNTMARQLIALNIAKGSLYGSGSGAYYLSDLLPYPGDPQTLYWTALFQGRRRILAAPYIAGLRLTVQFIPEPYVMEDPDGVLDPVTITPDPFTETATLANDYSASHATVRGLDHAGVITPQAQYRRTIVNRPALTESNGRRVSVNMRVDEYRPRTARNTVYTWTHFDFVVRRDDDAPSAWTYRWELEWMPYTPSSSGQFIASNSTSITRYGRRGYAIPGIFWGPDVASGDSARDAQYIDIRSFVGYIVRDEFLGKPGYYGTIVVDLTRQFYPTTGASNPELDVGDKITLYQGTTSRDYLVSAIRYRFRQGEQLRAQIECAPARVM